MSVEKGNNDVPLIDKLLSGMKNLRGQLLPVFKKEKKQKISAEAQRQFDKREQAGAFAIGKRGTIGVEIWLENQGDMIDIETKREYTEEEEANLTMWIVLTERGLNSEHYHELIAKGYSPDTDGFYAYTQAKKLSRKGGMVGEIRHKDTV